ncbi:MAG: ABC transporter ATP-binding protein/permease [Clostridia bacterium]|nr:ABC transporter ATP-binding protein/permease [Clostridia bacterium]
MAKGEKDIACALKLDGIVKTYGTGENAVQALKGVSVNFRESEFVSILGPSGCGKTTLLNIIGGLDRYTSGDLIIKGRSTKEYKDADWDTYRNNSIGFVFQSYNLIPHQTVISNVELALTLSGVSAKERRARAKEVLGKVGLKGLENKRPNQMSGGQMQRVAIARALINNPEIILADEPTGALDTETSVQVMELLKEVSKERLVIMVTHNPELAEKYSTRTIRLLDGEKVDDTNPFEFDGKSVSVGAEEESLENEVNVEEVKSKKKKAKKSEKGKAKMKIWTAFALSFSNLRTKKGRTILTSIAGSIGIIGIALVLAVSTGFSAYVGKLQADTLSVYPLTISESTIDLSDFQNLANKTITDEVVRQRVEQKVFTRAMFSDLTNMLKSNDINQEYEKADGTKIKYVDYVQNYIDSQNEKAAKTSAGWAYALQKGYGFDMNDFIFTEIGLSGTPSVDPRYNVMTIETLVKVIESFFEAALRQSGMNITADFVRSYIPTITEMPNNQKLLESQYEIIDEGGRWATEDDELMLVVDKYNRVSDITLALLGFNSIRGISTEDGVNVIFGNNTEFTFDQVKQKNFYYINNTDRYGNATRSETDEEVSYKYPSKSFVEEDKTPSIFESALPEDAYKLKITGVLRLKEGVSNGVLSSGIAYTSALVNKILNDEKNNSAPVVETATKVANGETESDKKITYSVSRPGIYSFLQKSYSVAELAASNKITRLSIYSADYDSKENMKVYLDKWNSEVVDHSGTTPEEKEAAKKAEVHYSDSTALLFTALNSIVDAVEIVLIAFTSISLVVSSIMIGIITYVSVVERTKEIGVLRAIGARKKDISRIFNAETFLIGLFAGIIGILATYILSIPINLIVGGLISGGGTIASLKITHALILVVVSFVLTLIAGLLPSRIAAKKDPVVALRTE